MAKTPVTLKVDDFKDREVAEVTYNFTQATDKEGQMSGIPRGGKINIKVKAMNDGNNELLTWMLNATMKKNGSLVFMKTTDGSDMKKIEFEQAYCVEFTEHWEDQVEGGTDLAHYEEIILSCRRIKCDSATYQNQWA